MAEQAMELIDLVADAIDTYRGDRQQQYEAGRAIIMGYSVTHGMGFPVERACLYLTSRLKMDCV